MTRIRFRRTAALLLLPLLAGACRDSVRIPPPDTRGAQRAVPEPEPSTVRLPITISLAAVAGQVERKVPHGQDEGDWRPLGSFPVVGTLYVKQAWQRDPLQLSLDGDHVDLSAHVRYRARVAAHPCVLGRCRWVQLAACGQDGPMPTVDVGLRTDLGFRRDWTVAPHTTPRQVRTGVHCRLTEARVDVTERVAQAVQTLLDGAASDVDERIRDAVQLRHHVQSVWRTVQQPISASKGVYVLLQPEALAATPPRGTGTTLTTNVSVVVRPRVVVGDRPRVRLKPLPESGTAEPGRGFRIQLVAELPFETMDSVVRAKLVGKRFDIRGHRVTVRRTRLYAAGTRVVLAATLTGDAKGTLYFVGTPVFDPDSQAISVPDLDFSVESRGVLPQVAEWLMYDQLRDQMRDAARFDLADRIARIRADVDRALDRELAPGVRSTGGVDSLTPLGVYVFSKSVAAVIDAAGHAEIRIDLGAPRSRGASSTPAGSGP